MMNRCIVSENPRISITDGVKYHDVEVSLPRELYQWNARFEAEAHAHSDRRLELEINGRVCRHCSVHSVPRRINYTESTLMHTHIKGERIISLGSDERGQGAPRAVRYKFCSTSRIGQVKQRGLRTLRHHDESQRVNYLEECDAAQQKAENAEQIRRTGRHVSLFLCTTFHRAAMRASLMWQWHFGCWGN